MGPTASGKTALAIALADRLNAELISADSRQVYRGMNLGTGKDLEEYMRPDGTLRPHHLIDICSPGDPFSLYTYVKLCREAIQTIQRLDKLPLVVGGTGLYIETLLSGRTLSEVAPNEALRSELEDLSRADLLEILNRYPRRPGVDLSTNRRIIRAIEVATFRKQNSTSATTDPAPPNACILGLNIERSLLVERIKARLKNRLQRGLVAEVRSLLSIGIPPQTLIGYGLEYKYVTLYLQGELTYERMQEQLFIAIRQFAKRQMTWFRGMERRGYTIRWIDGADSLQKQTEQALTFIRSTAPGNNH